MDVAVLSTLPASTGTTCTTGGSQPRARAAARRSAARPDAPSSRLPQRMALRGPGGLNHVLEQHAHEGVGGRVSMADIAVKRLRLRPDLRLRLERGAAQIERIEASLDGLLHEL